MAVHSFEVFEFSANPSSTPEEIEAAKQRVQAYSERFDAALRIAVASPDRIQALLELEGHEDFKRAHPTVEV
jgi:hypothetical protein